MAILPQQSVNIVYRHGPDTDRKVKKYLVLQLSMCVHMTAFVRVHVHVCARSGPYIKFRIQMNQNLLGFQTP